MSEIDPLYRIVTKDQYVQEKPTRLTPEDLCINHQYDIRLKVSKDEAAFAIDSLSLITGLMPCRNHYIVVRKQVRADIISPLENSYEVFPDGIIFHATKRKLFEVGYFVSAITDDDITLLGLGERAKNRKRQPALT